MSYISNRTRNRGFVFKSELQCGLWIVCLVICLPCVFTNDRSLCYGYENVVYVDAKSTMYIHQGSSLTILCSTKDPKYHAGDLEFRKGPNKVPSTIFNNNTIRLHIDKMETPETKTYYCKNTNANKMCMTRVVVDSPPPNVTDFHCYSKNLEVINCTWTAPDTPSDIKYNLTFFINGESVIPCKADGNGLTKFCSWNTTSEPSYRQQEDKYNFNLKFSNAFGSNEQNFTIDHFSIVKPDPVYGLKVLSRREHSVLLQWKIPNNMVDLLSCGLDHRIEYQIAKIDNTSYFHKVDASQLPANNKTYRFSLMNLPYAHKQYEVRIYIKPKKANQNYWSDFNYVVFYTGSEKPNQPPDMIAGAFTQNTYENSRMIYIYWKQIEEYEEAGANFTYKVLVKENGKVRPPMFPDKHKSMSYVVLDKASLDAIEVSVWSYNTNGSSENSSHLYIPPERDTNYFRITSFTKLAYENGTYMLSWEGMQNIDNYTLFWCQHNTTEICTGRLNFTVLDASQSHHVIDLSRDYRYQFAISANNGSSTSGMVWAKCDISKDGIAMYGFPVHLDHDAPGKSFVKLRWTMECALQDGIITGYNITYCPVIHTSRLCDNNVGNRSVYLPDPKNMDVNITNLLPFKTYQFTIALNTTYGLKTIENATTDVTTSEDVPTNPRNVTISHVKNDSLVISWIPPLHRNGNIGKYVIYNYGKEFYIDKFVPGTDISKREVIITGLQGFTNYSWTVQACNTALSLCSKINKHEGVFVRTRFGTPWKLKAPIVKNNPDILIWDPPEVASGTLDMYQIKIMKDDKETEILDTNSTSYSLIHCDDVLEVKTYQVRAVNFDNDPLHGILAYENVILPDKENNTETKFPGEWSEPSTVACRSKDGITMTVILMSIFALISVGYSLRKWYKKKKKMEDIKATLPPGIDIPEKDLSKYSFVGWTPANTDDKPSSDELLLLPDSKAATTVSSPENTKKNNENCGDSELTDSTGLSETSRVTARQISSSDDGSESSLKIEGGIKIDSIKDNQDSSSTTTECSKENSPYFNNKDFQKNPNSGYVQQVINPDSGNVQSSTLPSKTSGPTIIPQIPSTSSSTSYVMAGLSPSIFTTGVTPNAPPSQTKMSGGYVRADDLKQKSMMNFPKLGPSPTKPFGPESLPTMPSLTLPYKPAADSSYIQLQSLDSLPSLKPTSNKVPLNPTSSGYVSPDSAILNKHLNILSAGQLAEESAILDPTMSPDAYCRFSWSTDPANDNLHSLLADSSSLKSSKH